MTKKIIKILVSLVLVCAIIVGAIYGVKTYQRSKLLADVTSVSYISTSDNSYMESEGMVMSDADQYIYVETSQVVKEVFVQEGQTVKVGDKLIAFDVSNMEIELEIQSLRLEEKKNKIALLQKKLEILKNTTPIVPKEQKKTETNTENTEIGEGTEVLDIEEEEPEETGYTAEELALEIKKVQRELESLDLEKRMAELSLETQRESLSDGIVYAKINGTVKKVGNPDEISNDGSSFLEVVGSDGLCVKGDISELQLDKIQIGQTVTAYCWETGEQYEAVIKEIDQYPDTNPNYWGSGNPNVSYYKYTAFIENPQGLSNNMYLQLSIDDLGSNASESLYIDKSYVRKENGRSYVLKAEDGKLVKQYVTTGKTLWGYAIEITSGITMDDYLAFPYGKTGQEGVAVNPECMEESGDEFIDTVMY